MLLVIQSIRLHIIYPKIDQQFLISGAYKSREVPLDGAYPANNYIVTNILIDDYCIRDSLRKYLKSGSLTSYDHLNDVVTQPAINPNSNIASNLINFDFCFE